MTPFFKALTVMVKYLIGICSVIFNALEMFNSGDYDIKGEAVNTTDCITTANNLWRLFNPKLLQTLMIDRDNLITPELFQGDTNICIVSIGGGLPYHKFVLVKTSDSWVILCSYAGTYRSDN
jgi:hypothetical protein